ncbi:chaperonin 10-like protein [Aspergillus ambiguus]|uniref:zinc-binding alcohol dehydrogenase family protein n=1 Tax=Aspergillus ambiguus TaxID=176160 RepID=UPI003CCD42CA
MRLRRDALPMSTMSPATNTALYCDEKLSFGIRRSKETYAPEVGELRIETIYSGVNPADVKHATLLGIYPAVLGYDFCGKVVEAPTGSKFQPGDLVAGYTPTGVGRPAKYGTHQQHLVCPEDMLFSVPPNLPPDHAACLSVVTMTACDALYNIFKFPLPADNAGAKEPRPLLIWGASSSVGLSAVQLARASGVYPILVTASPKNHPLLLRMGATRCFDYKSPNAASEIRLALEQEQWGPILYGFDTVGSEAGVGSAQLMAGCVSHDAELVSVVVQQDPRFKMPFATTNSDVTLHVRGVPHPITIPARKTDYEHAWKAFQWAVVHYGSDFEFPSVEISKGSAEDALNQLEMIASHGRGLGKLVLQHPLQ